MPSTTEEFHSLVQDLEQALAQISARMNTLIQAVTDQPTGNVVDPADLAALHVAITEAHDLAAAAVQPPAGNPVPNTGVDNTLAEGAPSAGPSEQGSAAVEGVAGTPVADTGAPADGAIDVQSTTGDSTPASTE